MILAACTSAADQYGRHCLPPTGLALTWILVAAAIAVTVGLLLRGSGWLRGWRQGGRR